MKERLHVGRLRYEFSRTGVGGGEECISKRFASDADASGDWITVSIWVTVSR